LFLEEFPADAKSNRARLCLARVLGRGADFNRADALLSEVMAHGDGVERTMAVFLLAHQRYNMGRREESAELFRTLANKEELPAELRLTSMRRYAGIAHGKQDYPVAWLAFEQIAATGHDESSEMEARMQLAGLAFELVGRAKGTWPEVRFLCQSIISAPDSPQHLRATASLMHLETLFEEERWPEALQEAQAMSVQFQECVREYYMARVWEGITLHKLNRAEEAMFILGLVADSTIPKSEKFAGVEPAARAALWLAHVARQNGDSERFNHALEVLRTRYPDSEEARRASDAFGLPNEP
jgi:hypothetical protein